MKRVMALSLIVIIVLSLPACGPVPSTQSTAEPSPATAETAPAQEQATKVVDEAGEDLEAIAAIGDVEVDSGLFDVTITIPADFIGEVTQDQLDQSAIDHGYKSATLNDDDSVTYVMAKAQHEEMMEGVKQTIDDAIAAMAPSNDYPSFVSIEANNDYTEFKVVTTAEELGLMESFSVMIFYTYGGMYNHFKGTPVDNIHVAFINQSSGDIIQEANSRDMG